MPNVYVEPHPKGRPEGSAIDDYVVENHCRPCARDFQILGERRSTD